MDNNISSEQQEYREAFLEAFQEEAPREKSPRLPRIVSQNISEMVLPPARRFRVAETRRRAA